MYSPETLRDALLDSNARIPVPTQGAPSRSGTGDSRTMKQLLLRGSIKPRYGRLLDRLIGFMQCTEIIELGTSLGISTLYLSLHPHTRVTTLEANPELCRLARGNFKSAGQENIRIIPGDIGQQLPGLLNDLGKIDLAFMDANHRYAPTLDYFDQLLRYCHERSIIVLDDIHWSAEMSRAWKEIIHRKEVILSLDLFQFGLLFFDPSITPGHHFLSLR